MHYRTEAVGNLNFILFFLTNYVFVSILQDWNMLQVVHMPWNFWHEWTGRKGEPKKVPATTKWEHYLSYRRPENGQIGKVQWKYKILCDWLKNILHNYKKLKFGLTRAKPAYSTVLKEKGRKKHLQTLCMKYRNWLWI